MAQLGEAFDASTVEPRDDISPVPPGEYIAEIVESDIVDTKAKDAHGNPNGQTITLTWKIVQGDFENRRVWDRINFRHTNEVTQRIGQQALAELCTAVGLKGPLDDTTELHGVPVEIRVAIQPATDQYAASNVVKRYQPADGRPVAEARQEVKRAVSQAAPPKADAAGGSAPKWMRR